MSSEKYAEALRRINVAARSGATELHLAKLDLTILPPEIGWLAGLQRLNLSINNLVSLPPEIGNLVGLHELNLSGNRLTALPPEIGRLTELRTLDLSANDLASLPPEIGMLAGLRTLDLSNNHLAALPPNIGRFTELRRLDLSGNQLVALPAEIGTLAGLRTLDLSDNQLAVLPSAIGMLAALQTLHLFRNQLVSLPAEIGRLVGLRTLHLSSNSLAALPSEIGRLTELQTLYLSHNCLATLPAELGRLVRLQTLNLPGNNLVTLPPEIGFFSDLSQLILEDNQLSSLPESMAGLTSLKELTLHGNDGLGLPPEVLGPKYEDSSNANPRAKPADILAFYFNLQRARKEGPGKTRRLNECKVLVVGQPQSGKTRLVGWIITGKDPGEPDHTDGIKIGDWKVPVKKGDSRLGAETILAHIWDFGGQEIMQATHSFFLTERALYILVLDARNNEEQRRTSHWLERLRAFGKGSPVVVVLNKDDIPNKPPDMPQLRQDFGDLIGGDLHRTCAAFTGVGIGRLRDDLEERIRSLPNVNADWSKQWLDAKDRIAAITAERRRLSERDYRKLCSEFGIDKVTDQDALLSQLVTLGTLHRYHDPRHNAPGDVFVLDPEWVTEGVYSILNSPVLKAAGGRLQRSRLGDYFKNKQAYPESDRKFILGAMTMDQFELAFEIPERPGEFLVPEVLSTQTPPHGIDPREPSALNAMWRYRYLPDGVISRLTVRMHEKLERGPEGTSGWGGAWKNGAVLRLEGCRVLIRAAPEKSTVLCTVLGEAPRAVAALAIVRAMLESVHSAMNLKGVHEHVCAPSVVASARTEEVSDPWAGIETIERRTLEDLLIDPEAGPEHRHKLGGAWRTVAEWLGRVGLGERGSKLGKRDWWPEHERTADARDAASLTIQVTGDYVQGDKRMAEDRSTNIGGNVYNSQVGQTLTNCTNMVNQQTPGPKKDAMDQLRREVEDLLKRLPEDKMSEAPQVVEKLETAIKEAAKQEPDREWYSLSTKGLMKAAGWVSGFTDKIGKAVRSLGTLLWTDFTLPI